jgi:hypothetical protein
MGNVPSAVQLDYTQKAQTILRRHLHIMIKGIAESYATGMPCVENKAWIQEFLTEAEYGQICALMDTLYKTYPQQRKNPRVVNEIGHSMQNRTAIDLAGRFGV